MSRVYAPRKPRAGYGSNAPIEPLEAWQDPDFVEVEYVYDYTGSRLKKIVDGVVDTIYLGSGYEIRLRDQNVLKHITMGTQRIASHSVPLERLASAVAALQYNEVSCSSSYPLEQGGVRGGDASCPPTFAGFFSLPPIAWAADLTLPERLGFLLLLTLLFVPLTLIGYELRKRVPPLIRRGGEGEFACHPEAEGRRTPSQPPLRLSVLLWKLSALLFALIFLNHCTIGLVTDYGTSQPLPEVQIQVGGRVGTTDQNGIFAITGAPEGPQWIYGSKLAYFTYRQELEIQYAQTYSYYAHSFEMVAKKDACSKGCYYYTDHLGSIRVIADSEAKVLERIDYKPWGEVLKDTGSIDLPHKFTGQRYESEVDLYDYNARFYDPQLGRFIQADTIVPDPSNSQSFNRYSYVYNNPVKYTDPTGHFAFLVAVFVVLAFAVVSAIDAANNGAHGLDILKAAGMGALQGIGFIYPPVGVIMSIAMGAYSIAKDPNQAFRYLIIAAVKMLPGGKYAIRAYGFYQSIKNKQYASAGLQFVFMVKDPRAQGESKQGQQSTKLGVSRWTEDARFSFRIRVGGLLGLKTRAGGATGTWELEDEKSEGQPLDFEVEAEGSLGEEELGDTGVSVYGSEAGVKLKASVRALSVEAKGEIKTIGVRFDGENAGADFTQVFVETGAAFSASDRTVELNLKAGLWEVEFNYGRFNFSVCVLCYGVSGRYSTTGKVGGGAGGGLFGGSFFYDRTSSQPGP